MERVVGIDETACKNCGWWLPLDRDGDILPEASFAAHCEMTWSVRFYDSKCGNFCSMRKGEMDDKSKTHILWLSLS